MGNVDEGHTMITDIFAILMVISLGAMAGTAIGLVIGFALRKQKSEWSAMTSSEKSINISLIVVCSVVCIAGLAWYSLQIPLV
jgi:ABC-type antimicrobial peptide transport system permease subunit